MDDYCTKKTSELLWRIMNWKLPDALQKPMGFFKSSNETKQSSSDDLVHDVDDDLGINQIEENRDVPFLRMESAVRRFVDVALPVDLERLHKHKVNIIKWRSSSDLSKLRLEYENSSRTVKQITRNLQEMDTLRARVLEDDLEVFDYHLVPAKTKAQEGIDDFLSLRNHDSEIRTSGTQNFADFSNTEGVENSTEEILDHISRNKSRVMVQGNQLLIHASCEDDDPALPNEPQCGNLAILETQEEMVSPSQDLGGDDSWLKLQKDVNDLHEMMQTVSSVVHDQGKMVNDISSNVETAGDNIKKGTSQLKRATVLKAAMFPIFGAAIGGVIGGPIGMVAGLKLGSMTAGVAAAGVTGSVIGYQGGKALKKRHDEANSFEMIEVKKSDDSDDSTGSFELLDNDEPVT